MICVTILNQTYSITYILYKGYNPKNPDGPCCDASGYHARCLCKKQKVEFCKGICDSDDLCKGYVKYGKHCDIATTKSDCPPGCIGPKNKDNQGALVDTGHCATTSNYKGCIIKTISK